MTIHHFWPASGDFYERWSPVAHLGWIGVDLFFVISGFLIGGILLDTRRDERYFANFYLRRVLRIFPPCYAVVLSLFIVVPSVQAIVHGAGVLPGAAVVDLDRGAVLSGVPVAGPAHRDPLACDGSGQAAVVPRAAAAA